MNGQNEKNKLILIIAAVLLFAVSGMVLCYFQSKKETSPASSVSKEENKKETSNENEIPAAPAPIPAPPEVWKTYASAELGFFIKYPEMVIGMNNCIDYGTTEKQFYVPIKVFENNKNGIVYIAQEYYYDAETKWDPINFTTQVGLCNKITYSLESLQKEWQEKYLQETNAPFYLQSESILAGWDILIKNIKNEKELNDFIKENYGPSCFIKEKKQGNQKGIYDISIEGTDWAKNGDPEPVMTCGWSYGYKILYAPEKNKAMSVKLGQDCIFGTGYTSESYKCYDDEMIDSFRFE